MGIITSPFSFKFLIAPFMDFNFSRKIGRRMSWIVPTGIVASGLIFYMGYSVEELIQLGDGFWISFLMFVICLFIAVQDVAIDGIVCDILLPSDYDKGALM